MKTTKQRSKRSKTINRREPAWIKCDSCDDYFCTVHLMHVADCPCPPIEEWDTDPYTGTAPGPAA